MFCRLPDGLFTLSSLTHLVLNETFLECLPENMGKLVVLFSFLFLFKLRLIFFTHAYAVAAQTSLLNLEVPQYFAFLSISKCVMIDFQQYFSGLEFVTCFFHDFN